MRVKCPGCEQFTQSNVVDSRKSGKQQAFGQAVSVWRRRQCLECGTRFTTYEITKEQLERLHNDLEALNMLRSVLQ